MEIHILLDKHSWRPSVIPVISLIESSTSTPYQIRLSSYYGGYIPPGSLASSCYHLAGMSPMVQLNSPFPLLPHSSFLIYLDGCSSPVHMESVALSCDSLPVETTGWIYTMLLAPGFWNTLSSCAGDCTTSNSLSNADPLYPADVDPTKYTLQQYIIPCRPAALSQSSTDPTVTVVYKFCLPSPSTEPDQPNVYKYSLNHGQVTAIKSYNR